MASPVNCFASLSVPAAPNSAEWLVIRIEEQQMMPVKCVGGGVCEKNDVGQKVPAQEQQANTTLLQL